MSSLLIILLRPCSTDRYMVGRCIGMAREKDLNRKLWPSCRAGCPSGSHLRSPCSNAVGYPVVANRSILITILIQEDSRRDEVVVDVVRDNLSSHEEPRVVKDGIFRFRKRGRVDREERHQQDYGSHLVLWQLATEMSMLLIPSRLRQVNLESHNCSHWPRDVSGLLNCSTSTGVSMNVRMNVVIVVKSREISAMSNRAQVTLLNNSDAFPLTPSLVCVSG